MVITTLWNKIATEQETWALKTGSAFGFLSLVSGIAGRVFHRRELFAFSTLCLGGTLFQAKKIYNQFDGYRQFEKSKILEIVKDRNAVALMVQSNHDENARNIKELSAITGQLSRGGYTPVFRSVDGLTDLDKTIEKLKANDNIIKLLWIKADGGETEVKLGGKDIQQNLSVNNSADWTRILNKIHREAFIVLESRYTAGIRSFSHTIANEMASILKGRTILAPSSYITSVKINTIDPLEVVMMTNSDDQDNINYNSIRTFYFEKKENA